MLPLSIFPKNPVKANCLILALCLSTLIGCQRSGMAPQTKEDSLKIAQAYFNTHSGESKAIITWSNDSTPTTFLTNDEVREFLDRYEKDPVLLNKEGVSLKGFVFAGTDFERFKSDPRLRGIYVGFANKPNGDFTVMFRGLDEKGSIILKSTDTAKQISGGEPVIAMAIQGPPACPPNINCPPPPPEN